MYISRNDSIASEHNLNTASYPKGSFEIGLQLLSNKTKPAPQHGSSSVEATNGAYTMFNYGTYGVPNGTNGNSQLVDAIATRDSTTWLPLGVVIPTDKHKKAVEAAASALKTSAATPAKASASSKKAAAACDASGGASSSASGASSAPRASKKPRGRPRKTPLGDGA